MDQKMQEEKTRENQNQENPDPNKILGKNIETSKIPRMLEVLVMQGSVDAAFLEELIQKRSKCLEGKNFQLTDEEKALLDAMPENQLRAFAQRITIPPEKRSILARIFLSSGEPSWVEGALILSLLGVVTFSALSASGGGHRSLFEPISKKAGETGTSSESALTMAITSDLRGKPFEEAIKLLEKETGYKIDFKGIVQTDSRKLITENIQGMPFRSALVKVAEQVCPATKNILMEYPSTKRICLSFIDKKEGIPR